jgi:curved DNA-binding protein CbpA
MQNEQPYYTLLGIAPNASEDEITAAYRKLAFQYHPDKNNGSQEATERMKEINEAYAILSDPLRRKQYDMPLGYRALTPKFRKGSKVKVTSNSNSPYRDHTGVVDKEPVKDTFRFWYMVKFDSQGKTGISRFAEEELDSIE